jgi:hypothetical protein
MRTGLLIALLLATSCKKEAPKGDLPPVGEAKPADPAPAAAPPANPHGSMTSTGTSPHGSMPGKTDARSLEKLPDGRFALGPFSIAVPDKWTEKPVTSSMRAADLILPGNDAELIVYYFGEGGAGSIDDNLDRWLGQFQQPDGKKSRDVAKIEKTKFADQDATYVAVSGRFVAAAMPGGEAVDKTDQAMLAAIVSSPSGPYYFKLVGNKATVDAQAKAFRAMLGSMKLR